MGTYGDSSVEGSCDALVTQLTALAGMLRPQKPALGLARSPSALCSEALSAYPAALRRRNLRGSPTTISVHFTSSKAPSAVSTIAVQLSTQSPVLM